MNILIAGAAGFIGRALVQALKGQPYNVFGLDLKKAADLDCSSMKDFFVQDITQPFKLSQPFDCVFHLAALNFTHVGKPDSNAYARVNVQGTENLLKAVTTKKIVFMSTAKVYRRQERIDEDAQILPRDDYEKSKWLGEELCRRYLKPEQLIILRPVNIVGPGQAEKAILPVFFRNAVENKPIEIFAPRNTPMQFLYIDDVVRLFKWLITNNNVSGVFNLSSGKHISLEDLASKILTLTNSRSQVRVSNNQDAVFSEVISLKAEKALNWRPQVSIEEILRRYCEAGVKI